MSFWHIKGQVETRLRVNLWPSGVIANSMQFCFLVQVAFEVVIVDESLEHLRLHLTSGAHVDCSLTSTQWVLQ